MKSSIRGHFPFVPGILLILFFGFLYFRDPLVKQITPPEKAEPGFILNAAPVFSIIDGDTIGVIIDGKEESVRLIGIDSPEYGRDGMDGQCYHEDATERMKELVENETVRLESDPSQSNRDTYGRLLRYIFLPDGENVGELMIREGFAREYTYLGNPYLYQDDFVEAEKHAKTEKVGIWSDECID